MIAEDFSIFKWLADAGVYVGIAVLLFLLTLIDVWNV